MKTFKSFAQWPSGTLRGMNNDISEDSHETESAANAVCDKLNEEGFGGYGNVFPIKTWTEPIVKE